MIKSLFWNSFTQDNLTWYLGDFFNSIENDCFFSIELLSSVNFPRRCPFYAASSWTEEYKSEIIKQKKNTLWIEQVLSFQQRHSQKHECLDSVAILFLLPILYVRLFNLRTCQNFQIHKNISTQVHCMDLVS